MGLILKLPVLTYLSKVWSLGEVYFQDTHRNIKTGHHRYWQNNVYPHHPTDVAAEIAREKPEHFLPKESGRVEE